MNEWTLLASPEDAAQLLREFCGFHDSCLVRLAYESGAFVGADGGMGLGSPEERVLHMIFHSQWTENALELCFTGVRRFFVVGWQERYFCDIFDCYLALHRDLLPGRDDPLVVWADSTCFCPRTALDRDRLAEPETSFVIAAALKWRFVPRRAPAAEAL